MALNFDKFASEGNAFLKKLAVELKVNDDTEKAGRILKAILHTLRNHLSVEESVQLLAQFPMFLKAVYVDSWSLKKHERVKHLEDFIREIKREDGRSANGDFENDEDVKHAIAAIFISLRQYISDGEMHDIAAQLPADLKDLVLQQVIVEKANPAQSI